MIRICGKEYYIDIDKFFETFTGLELNENEINTVITATYSDETSSNDLSLLTKEVVESKRNGIESLYSLRYDTIKDLLDTLLQQIYDENGNLLKITSLNDLSFPQQFAFNSLLHKGIIKEKNIN